MRFLCTAFLIFATSSCTLNEDFINDSMDRFDDQAYKDVIGLVELYKLRNGKYPASLDAIRFEGDWDMLNQQTIHYELKSDGYLVNVHGMEIDTVQYPDAFYVGLGIVRK